MKVSNGVGSGHWIVGRNRTFSVTPSSEGPRWVGQPQPWASQTGSPCRHRTKPWPRKKPYNAIRFVRA